MFRLRGPSPNSIGPSQYHVLARKVWKRTLINQPDFMVSWYRISTTQGNPRTISSYVKPCVHLLTAKSLQSLFVTWWSPSCLQFDINRANLAFVDGRPGLICFSRHRWKAASIVSDMLVVPMTMTPNPLAQTNAAGTPLLWKQHCSYRCHSLLGLWRRSRR